MELFSELLAMPKALKPCWRALPQLHFQPRMDHDEQMSGMAEWVMRAAHLPLQELAMHGTLVSAGGAWPRLQVGWTRLRMQLPSSRVPLMDTKGEPEELVRTPDYLAQLRGLMRSLFSLSISVERLAVSDAQQLWQCTEQLIALTELDLQMSANDDASFAMQPRAAAASQRLPQPQQLRRLQLLHYLLVVSDRHAACPNVGHLGISAAALQALAQQQVLEFAQKNLRWLRRDLSSMRASRAWPD